MNTQRALAVPPDFLGVDTSNQQLWKVPALSLGMSFLKHQPALVYIASFRDLKEVSLQPLEWLNKIQCKTKKDPQQSSQEKE
jgi:hypothetical protein